MKVWGSGMQACTMIEAETVKVLMHRSSTRGEDNNGSSSNSKGSNSKSKTSLRSHLCSSLHQKGSWRSHSR